MIPIHPSVGSLGRSVFPFSRALAGGRLVVADDLVVRVCRYGIAARVPELEADVDQVAVAMERIRLDGRDAARTLRLEPDLELVRAGAQAALAGERAPQGSMVRHALADQPALRNILVLRSEQDEVLRLILHILVLAQLEPCQGGAQ